MTGLSVSVVIPVFNGERFLAEAIESVLVQDYRPLQVIVVDDGSTDATARIANGFGERIQCVWQANRGLPGARNTGVRLAQGDVIGFLDDDDLWSPGKLASQTAVLEASPSVDIVLGHLQRLKLAPDKRFIPHNGPELALNLGASLIRRRVFDTIGVFDEAVRFADDWDWYMRAREAGIRILVQDEVVLFYRRHEDNLTNQRDVHDQATVRILKRSLDRRRGRDGEASSLPPVDERTLGEPPGDGACQ